MSWAHEARKKQLAPIGEYKPETYRVKVHDTFQQYTLRMAAQVIRSGMTVPEFLLFCVAYVLRNHREMKRFRSIFRKGAREILAAAAKPVGPGFMFPESERDRRREKAFERFAERAESVLFAEETR